VTVAFIDEERIRAVIPTDEKIEPAIAIHVGKRGAGGKHFWTSNARLLRHVFKTPLPEIAIKRVPSLGVAKIEIAETVAIEVPSRDAGALHEVVILRRTVHRTKHVVNWNSACASRDACEANFARLFRIHCGTAIAGMCFPLQRLGGESKRCRR
jgi:hypothetical protein